MVFNLLSSVRFANSLGVSDLCQPMSVIKRFAGRSRSHCQPAAAPPTPVMRCAAEHFPPCHSHSHLKISGHRGTASAAPASLGTFCISPALLRAALRHSARHVFRRASQPDGRLRRYNPVRQRAVLGRGYLYVTPFLIIARRHPVPAAHLLVAPPRRRHQSILAVCQWHDAGIRGALRP